MNKKVAIISDIHFGVNKNSEMFLTSSLNFFENQFVPYLIKNDIKVVLVLGDVFESRSSINVRTSDEVWNLFDTILSQFEVKVLIGNHDIYYKNSNDIHSLRGINQLSNIEVISTIKHIDILGVNCLMCPWVIDYNDTSFQNELINSDADILFGHFDIVGFALNNTRISTDGLDSSIFSGFKKVFSGHYHTPSAKKVGRTEIIYIGSPYQMDRNDVGQDKGFIILNLETLRYKRISNDTSVRFIRVEYPDLPDKNEVVGNIVDAYITIHKDHIKNNVIDQYLSDLECMNPAEKINPILTVISDDYINLSTGIENGIHSIPDLLELYINSDDDMDDDEKEEIFNITMNIYDEVKV